MRELNMSRVGGFLADFSLLVSTIVWGLSFTILKRMLGHQVSPILFVFLRFAMASILLLPFCLRGLRSLDKAGLKAGVFLGLLLFAGFFFQTLGITYTTASKSAFITGLSAVFVPVFMVLHRRRLPEPLMIVAIILAIFGMFLLTGPAGGRFIGGDLLTLFCAVAFGAQIYVMGNVAWKYDPLALTLVEMAAAAGLAALMLPFEAARLQLTLSALAAFLFMIIFATAGALAVQTWAQRKTSAVRAGLIYTSEPVFAYMFASALLGEHFNYIQKVGGAIIILAVLSAEVAPVILEKARRKAT